MPSNADFSLSVLVGGVCQPEYEIGGVHYVESKLCTPFTFKQHVCCIVDGENESQNFDVTPYQLLIRASSTAPVGQYCVFVDGYMVTTIILKPGRQQIVRGFCDGNEVRQFLFSLPRFSEHASDKLAPGLEQQVGTIRVQCWNGSLEKAAAPYCPPPSLVYRQANKKDGGRVTKGGYTMVTTKVGRKIKNVFVVRQTNKVWRRGELRSDLALKYLMGHSLTDMGVTLQPVDWSAKWKVQEENVCSAVFPLNVPPPESSPSDPTSISHPSKLTTAEDA